MNPNDAALVFEVAEVLGVPQDRPERVTTSLSELPPALAARWEETWTAGDFTAVVTQIQAAIEAITEPQRVKKRLLLARWAQLHLALISEAQDGVKLHFECEMDRVRERLGNLLGIAVPPGGFLAERRETRSLQTDHSRGGPWLGAVRCFIQCKFRNGSTVQWDSDDVLEPHATVRHFEDAARAVEGAAVREADAKLAVARRAMLCALHHFGGLNGQVSAEVWSSCYPAQKALGDALNVLDGRENTSMLRDRSGVRHERD
jgi:hypothetical protein